MVGRADELLAGSLLGGLSNGRGHWSYCIHDHCRLQEPEIAVLKELGSAGISIGGESLVQIFIEQYYDMLAVLRQIQLAEFLDRLEFWWMMGFSES